MPLDKSELYASDVFAPRHLGPREEAQREMLASLGFKSLDDLCAAALPEVIVSEGKLDIPAGRTERDALAYVRGLADKNELLTSHIGTGYYDCIVPSVILRNILENPAWYTPYTPYQAEVSQGRLEALLNFQTMVAELTGLPLANSSLLDEATAAAEALNLCRSVDRKKRVQFFVDETCHPQTLAVLEARAIPLGIELVVGDAGQLSDVQGLFGALVQYPNTNGDIVDPSALAEKLHAEGALLVVATDLLALCTLTSPGDLGADVAIGSSQRFGVPMGYGGPHAAFMSTQESHKRHMPGRMIGVSKDAQGKVAYRLALQTREQHIRRDKATSNICTAQVLLAVMASMYCVYHGPEGLKKIAKRVRGLTMLLRAGLAELGYETGSAPVFDTLRVALTPERGERLANVAVAGGRNLRLFKNAGCGDLGISLDETSGLADVEALLGIFAEGRSTPSLDGLLALVDANIDGSLPDGLLRSGPILSHPVFQQYRAEHELLRYIHRLQAKDVALTTSMIALGSCTMKLNATSEMLPISWPEFANMHPFAPTDQAQGYRQLFTELEQHLKEITGFAGVSLQPNAGSQGEYAGLLVIAAHHRALGQSQRDVCLIPRSAHGTNPASAVIAGFRVVVVGCDDDGNIDVADLEAKAKLHADKLGALMVTYPSTHGVFEASIKDICAITHRYGGQVYMDGANMNAQVGLCKPGEIGADVCHLNLHKTFAIPHGGGGPGMGPIGVAAHLAPYLPGHPVSECGGSDAIGPVSAAAWGSAGILPISFMYILMLGADGLKAATQVAILNANYMAKRLSEHYDVVFTGQGGLVAHEFVLDARGFKASSGIEVEDMAKRLIDFGFHSPTMSWPVPGTLMVEPTESESRAELDRFCDALIAIRQEIADIEAGKLDRIDNPLKNAPHPAEVVGSDDWGRAYTRKQAAYPLPWVQLAKYWPPVSRVDNTYGDRNLMCLCPSPEEFE